MAKLDGTKGHKLQATDELQEKVVTRSLTFKLTEEEFAEKGKQASTLHAELKKLKADAAEQVKVLKEGIKAKEEERNATLTVIRNGEEERDVKCIEQRDYNAHAVRYIFNGDVMDERPMEEHERQFELVKEEKAKAKKKPKRKTGAEAEEVHNKRVKAATEPAADGQSKSF